MSELKSRRKAMPTNEETSRLMMVRDVFRQCGGKEPVCVVLPDGKTEAEVFGNYYQSIRSRLHSDNVVVVNDSDLTEKHLSITLVVDLTEIVIIS